MNGIDSVLLDDARAIFLKRITALWGRNNLQEAFSAWLLANRLAEFKWDKVTDFTKTRNGLLGNYQDVAILGFVSQFKELSSPQLDSLYQSIKRLTGRETYINDIPAEFCSDGEALLGIVLGTKQLAKEELSKEVVSWLNKVSKVGFEMEEIPKWRKGLIAISMLEAGIHSEETRFIVEPILADVRVALHSKDLISLKEFTSEADELATLRLIKESATTSAEITRAAIQLAALEFIKRAAPTVIPGRYTVEQVTALLNRVEAGLRRWTWEDVPKTRRAGAQARKWEIDHEYHVQNLLYAILAPIFLDLEDEIYTEPVGQKKPRADLAIPSLKLIIEVKYMFPNTTPQDIIDQIATDKSLYFVEASQYQHFVGFIWDSTSRINEHDKLRQGLKKLGLIDAIIASKPGNWV